MLEYREEHIESKEKTLRDFIPMVLTFFVGLTVLSVYQNTMLYAMGVLDNIFNGSFLLYLLHHLGFTAAVSIPLAFIFNLLENKKPGIGLKTIKTILILMLINEAGLITYYIQNFEPLGADLLGLLKNKELEFSFSQVLVVSSFTLAICFVIHKYIASFYTVISRMYPLTIVFFSIFLATLYSDKKPVNENKTQHLAEHLAKSVFQTNQYDGTEEYPLLSSFQKETGLSDYFHSFDSLPHIKVIMLDGLGNDFVNGRFTAFMPRLQELKRKSLSWNNFLSNTGESHASFPMIIGSLPFGEAGFTTLQDFTYRNTLYSILRENGYGTSFNYGGNTALFNIDRFLEEEKVDQIYDRNNFGNEFTLQEEDAAGITLGYPDEALFSNYHKTLKELNGPRLDVFLTLSTKTPFHIPHSEKHLEEVIKTINSSDLNDSEQRFVRRNEELFASFSYADEVLAKFMDIERTLPSFSNTIYVITGSHQLSEISQKDPISKYRVPLLIYSPKLKFPAEIEKVASHADIAPSILALLSSKNGLEVPDQLSFLGDDLVTPSILKIRKEIPLLRSAYKFEDYIVDDLFYTDGNMYRLDQNLNLLEGEIGEEANMVERRFNSFKSINNYVTSRNKIIPASLSLIEDRKPQFSKEDMIWIESVFNGKDFDNAYTKAKSIAFKKDYGRAMLLCEYILSEIPRHADTEILMGRIKAWQGDYDKAIEILKGVVEKYPSYGDGYCALMDAYFWSGNNDDTYRIQRFARKNGVQDKILDAKFERSIAIKNNESGTAEKEKIERETVEIGSKRK